MALVTLQTIFQDAFPAYEQRHALPAHVRRAAHALMPCRTAALGGHIQACPDGHVARVWYNSCRHRSWPVWPKNRNVSIQKRIRASHYPLFGLSSIPPSLILHAGLGVETMQALREGLE